MNLGSPRNSSCPLTSIVTRPPTPGGSDTPGHCGVPTQPPLVTRSRAPDKEKFRGSMSERSVWLSTLRDAGHPMHHARLASGCWPALPGGIGYPQGPQRKVSEMQSLHLFPLSQASPAATSPFFPGCYCGKGQRGLRQKNHPITHHCTPPVTMPTNPGSNTRRKTVAAGR